MDTIRDLQNVNKKNVALCLGGLILLLSFSQVTSRNKDWNSRYSLYKNDILNFSSKINDEINNDINNEINEIDNSKNSKIYDSGDRELKNLKYLAFMVNVMFL